MTDFSRSCAARATASILVGAATSFGVIVSDDARAISADSPAMSNRFRGGNDVALIAAPGATTSEEFLTDCDAAIDVDVDTTAGVATAKGICRCDGVALVAENIGKGGNKVWTIRNSWGANWGEQGHARIAREVQTDISGNNVGVCGINKNNNLPVYYDYWQ